MAPKTKLLKFRSVKENKTTDNGKVVESGNLGTLLYEVYKPNPQFAVINISNIEKTLAFKKDALKFETELSKLDFKNMKEGDVLSLKGSGDNDDLVFTFKDGELEVSLKERESFPIITKLKDILKRKGQKE